MPRLTFFIKQLSDLPLSTADLTGRIAIVTGTTTLPFHTVTNLVGANVGLGLEAARHLAAFNPKKLILACRNQEKGDNGVRYINATTNVAPGVVECWELDLASFKSVKSFAKRGNSPKETLLRCSRDVGKT
jgi:retinol dehydrogenase 12